MSIGDQTDRTSHSRLFLFTPYTIWMWSVVEYLLLIPACFRDWMFSDVFFNLLLVFFREYVIGNISHLRYISPRSH